MAEFVTAWFLVLTINVFNGGGPVSIPMENIAACQRAVSELMKKDKNTPYNIHKMIPLAVCISSKGQVVTSLHHPRPPK